MLEDEMTGRWSAPEVVSDRHVILMLGPSWIQIAVLAGDRRALSRTR